MQDWWVAVGAGISTKGAQYINLVFQPNSSIAYLAFQDSANFKTITVVRFTGTTWSPIDGLSTGVATYISMAFKPNNSQLYLAYSDADYSGAATVVTYTGASWNTVGSAGFSAGRASFISLVFMPSTSWPFIAFSDNLSKAHVMAFGGDPLAACRPLPGSTVCHPGSAAEQLVSKAIWFTVGSSSFSTGIAACTNLAFEPSTSTPYLAYSDDASATGKATVMRLQSYDGVYGAGQWVVVGSAGISIGIVTAVSLAFPPNSSAGVPTQLTLPSWTVASTARSQS